MSTQSLWPVNNTVVLKLSGLRNRAGTYQNSATVTLISLTDATGNSVTGITYPLALDYVTASSGDYEVEIGPSVGVVKDTRYRGTVRAVVGQRQYQSVEKILCVESHD